MTLFELVVVMAILSGISMLVFPRLPSANQLKKAASSTASLIREAETRAVTGKCRVKLLFQLENNRIVISESSAGAADTVPGGGLPHVLELPDKIRIEDIMPGSDNRIKQGELSFIIGQAGWREPLILHLLNQSDKGRMTVMAFPAGGKVIVMDGYQEEVP